MTPHYLKSLGFQHQSSHIEIGEYTLFFVPYELSLEGCRLLLFLSPGEIDFFNKYAEKLSKLNITVINPATEKTEIPYMRGSFRKLMPLESSTPSSLLSFTFKTRSAAYEEALINLFEKDSYLRNLYANDDCSTFTFSSGMIDTILDTADARICYSNLESGALRIVNLGINSIRCFGEFNLEALKDEGITKVLVKIGRREIPLICGFQKKEPSHEVEGFWFIDFSVEFNSALVETVAGYIDQTSCQNPEEE